MIRGPGRAEHEGVFASSRSPRSASRTIRGASSFQPVGKLIEKVRGALRRGQIMTIAPLTSRQAPLM